VGSFWLGKQKTGKNIIVKHIDISVEEQNRKI
jgi:hypothetical protein